MKLKFLMVLIVSSIFLPGCSKHSNDTTRPETDVYVCGYANLNDAVYWKNSVQTILGNAFNTTGIALSGSDVYVAGNIGFAVTGGGSANAAVYWKNGTMVKLGNDPSYANSITVSGTDVYVCGYASVNNLYAAAYWKNGVLRSLGNEPHSGANAIAVSGYDVYVAGNAGQNGSMAVYWKNGTQVQLENGSANAILISGSDLYVAGSVGQNTSAAVYWKNGLKVNLNDASVDTNVVFTSATGIAVYGADVHVIGYINQVFAVYWKDGIRIDLNNPATYVNISNNKNSIVVKDNDVYISLNSADYWHNGKIVHVGSGYATAIAIKQ